jgi:hypothetical protein
MVVMDVPRSKAFQHLGGKMAFISSLYNYFYVGKRFQASYKLWILYRVQLNDAQAAVASRSLI